MSTNDAELNDFRFPVDRTEDTAEQCLEIAAKLLSGIPAKELREANDRTRERTIKAALRWAQELVSASACATAPAPLASEEGESDDD